MAKKKPKPRTEEEMREDREKKDFNKIRNEWLAKNEHIQLPLMIFAAGWTAHKKYIQPKTRGEKAGKEMADALLEWLHLMYQKDTQIRVLQAMIDRLEERKSEMQRENRK